MIKHALLTGVAYMILGPFLLIAFAGMMLVAAGAGLLGLYSRATGYQL